MKFVDKIKQIVEENEEKKLYGAVEIDNLGDNRFQTDIWKGFVYANSYSEGSKKLNDMLRGKIKDFENFHEIVEISNELKLIGKINDKIMTLKKKLKDAEEGLKMLKKI